VPKLSLSIEGYLNSAILSSQFLPARVASPLTATFKPERCICRSIHLMTGHKDPQAMKTYRSRCKQTHLKVFDRLN
jgi:hypothetical protein